MFEVVASFCYLGDMLYAGGGCNLAAATRVKTGWKKFKELLPVLSCRHLSFKTRGRLYSTNVTKNPTFNELSAEKTMPFPSRFNTPIAKITSQLYLCGIGCITKENIQRKGITHILNTAEELKDFIYPDDCNLVVKHVLMRDIDTENLLKYLDSCVDYVHEVCKCNGSILVHCVAGVSRSASVCIAYLVKYKKMTLKQAYYLVFNKRPCIFPNFGFWRQLVEYEIQVRGDYSVELKPYVLGFAPDILKNDVEYRIRLGWMDELFALFSVHMLILIVQMVSLMISLCMEKE